MNKARDIESKIEQLLTVNQVAKLLNVGVRTIWRLDKDEKIPAALWIGHRKRWLPEDINHWLGLNCPNRKEYDRLKERDSKCKKRK